MFKRKIGEVSTSFTLKGVGDLGCVISPAIECNPYYETFELDDNGIPTQIAAVNSVSEKYTTDIKESSVFKILDKANADKEFTKSQDLLKKGNNLSYHGIIKSIKGNYNNFHKSFDDIKELCVKGGFRGRLMPIKHSDITSVADIMMLIYEDGGEDLISYQDTLIDHFSKSNTTHLNKFFNSLKNLFVGLQKFKESRIMHGDIKKDNIVYNEESGVAKFIDFDNATTEDKLVDAVNNYTNGKFFKEISRQHAYYVGVMDSDPLYKIKYVGEIKRLVTAFSYMIKQPHSAQEALIDQLKKDIVLVINRTDLNMLCQELIHYLLRIKSLLDKQRIQPDVVYSNFLTKFETLLNSTLINYQEPNILETLIEEYDALLETLPSTTGGYNKKSNKRKTKRKRKSKRKSNKRKTKRNSNKRKINKNK